MGRDVILATPSGPVNAWRADPPHGAAALGAVVVIQEIFGVNAHIRSVADGYAAAGYVALAPALFDPVARHVELAYDADGFARGREIVEALGTERAVGILRSCRGALHTEGHRGIGVVGFCWGGTLAFLANTRLALPAVSYYGARTVPFLDEPLQAPMLFQFGAEDSAIPPEDIARHRSAQPDAEFLVHPGEHGFNRDVDPDHYHAASAAAARRATLAFLDAALRQDATP
ncbi:dienelactone hydrolase family protein [Luteimonas fraxinea]|uniref:Dienelactone hydrolase family protein n=1 Tax=Luteimonas fraxinea TaxID=2901869 RepID=A0ABS8UE75_9GAMM|nr:dienelactone hydrolase family protein [Luteimonas fraxinea]MCD9097791.1 dienelactone hydrolase family protein [Luteimonas fraxinea]MCD9126488.1 dienelactone hydrolase family protein [Luteimonas fraxinea]UHH09462.1 dienelactone hydrolase family protein [Luteimonas fraxinea]